MYESFVVTLGSRNVWFWFSLMPSTAPVRSGTQRWRPHCPRLQKLRKLALEIRSSVQCGLYPSGRVGKLGKVHREAESGTAARANPVRD